MKIKKTMKTRFALSIHSICAGAGLLASCLVPVFSQSSWESLSDDDWQAKQKSYRQAVIEAKTPSIRADILKEFAMQFVRRKQYEEAEPLLAQCLAIQQKKSETELSTLQTLSNLALVKHKLKKEEEAESLYKECVEKKRKVCPETSSLALTLTNLANLYSEARRPTDAEPLYLEAYEIDKKLGGENHIECGQDLFNLGGMYYKCNEPKKALTFFDRAEKIFEASGTQAHEQLVRALHYSALCHSALEDHQSAIRCNEKALSLQESVKGQAHGDTVIHLLNLAHAKSKIGKTGEALSLYQKALARANESSPQNQLRVCECYGELANFYRVQKQYVKAEDNYKKALEHYQHLSKREKRGLYSLPHSYSVMLQELKRSEDSHHVAHEYLHVFKPHQKSNSQKDDQP